MPLTKTRHANFQPFNPEHKGALHRYLGIPEDEKIPVTALHTALAKAKAEGDEVHRKMIQIALTARHWHHGTLHLPKK